MSQITLTGLLWRKIRTAARMMNKDGLFSIPRYVLRNWRVLIWKWRAERLQAQSAESDYILVPNVNGFTMLVSNSDEGIGRELLTFRVHEPIATHLLPSMVRSGETVLSVGANIGYYTLLMSRLVGEHGRIIALEPNPETYQLLKLNLQLNRVSNVETYQLAASNTDGTNRLFVVGSSNLCTLKPVDDAISSIDVVTTTIDSLVSKLGYPIHAIRMDVEGYEGEVLEGAEATLKKYKPKLFIEFHLRKLGLEQARIVLGHLSEFGYRVKFLTLRDKDWPWEKRPWQVWRDLSLSSLLDHQSLMQASETFTLMLESDDLGGGTKGEQ